MITYGIKLILNLKKSMKSTAQHLIIQHLNKNHGLKGS